MSRGLCWARVLRHGYRLWLDRDPRGGQMLATEIVGRAVYPNVQGRVLALLHGMPCLDDDAAVDRYLAAAEEQLREQSEEFLLDQYFTRC